MKIYIPSRGRAGEVETIKQFDQGLLARTVLVVPDAEVDAYREREGRRSAAMKIVGFVGDGIADKRHSIGLTARNAKEPTFCMVDDDLTFFHHRDSDDWHLERNTPDDMNEMFRAVEDYLSDFALVSVSSREGNNRLGVGRPPLPVVNTRPQRVLAFRTADFLDVEHRRVRCMEDFDVALQLLRRGLPNAVLAYWAHDQKQTQAGGGCSVWRTHEVHDAAARRLHELHPGFVRLRQKKNKTGGAFGERTEVTISWKKAFASAE